MRRREWMTAMRMSEFCFPTLVSFHLPPVSLKRPVAPDSVEQRRLKLDSIARCHTGSKKITICRTAKKPIASVRKPPSIGMIFQRHVAYCMDVSDFLCDKISCLPSTRLLTKMGPRENITTKSWNEGSIGMVGRVVREMM